MTATSVQLSVIVPVGSRYDDVSAVLDAYRTVLDGLDVDYELIYVLDGPQPDVLEILRAEQTRHASLEILQLARSFGEATAIVAGFEVSRGAMILTLPAYFQVDPAEIGRLLEYKADYHMVVAHRWPRAGGSFEKVRRSVFHGMLRLITGQSFRDLGCGVRLFDRAVLEEISIYGDQHRFLPLLAQRNGFRVLEHDMSQSARDQFRGRYGFREYLRKALDILTVFFLIQVHQETAPILRNDRHRVIRAGCIGLDRCRGRAAFFRTGSCGSTGNAAERAALGAGGTDRCTRFARRAHHFHARTVAERVSRRTHREPGCSQRPTRRS